MRTSVDPHRGTGRTTRMIGEAILRAERGEHVIIVMQSAPSAAAVASRLQDMLSGKLCTRISTVPAYDFGRRFVFGTQYGSSASSVLVDHFMTTNTGRLHNELEQWRIRGPNRTYRWFTNED